MRGLTSRSCFCRVVRGLVSIAGLASRAAGGKGFTRVRCCACTLCASSSVRRFQFSRLTELRLEVPGMSACASSNVSLVTPFGYAIPPAACEVRQFFVVHGKGLYACAGRGEKVAAFTAAEGREGLVTPST